jgi:hypothetical protein
VHCIAANFRLASVPRLLLSAALNFDPATQHMQCIAYHTASHAHLLELHEASTSPMLSPVRFASCGCAGVHHIAADLGLASVPRILLSAALDVHTQAAGRRLVAVVTALKHSLHSSSSSAAQLVLDARTSCALGRGEAPCGSSHRPQTQPMTKKEKGSSSSSEAEAVLGLQEGALPGD